MIQETLKRILLTEDTTPKGFPIPDHVKAVRVNKGNYVFAIWENPHAVQQEPNEFERNPSKGYWQGTYLQVDGDWAGSVAPGRNYGYASKQELMKELLIRVKSRGSSKGPLSPYNASFNVR